MSNYSDAKMAKLREISDALDREIAQAPPTATLRATWAELVAGIAK